MLPARILGHAISLVYLRKRDRCQIPFGIPGVSPCPVIQHKGFERESRRVLRIVSGRCQPIELFTEIRFAAPMPTSIDGEIAAQVDALAAVANPESVKKILTLLERRKAFAKANK